MGGRRPRRPVTRRQPGEPAAGRLAQRRVGVRGRDPAQLGDQPGRRERPARRRRRGRERHAELLEEAARPVLAALAAAHRRDHEPLPGTGHRDVEQPALLGQQLGPAVGRPLGAAGREALDGQLPRPEQGAALPQVRPDALLDARHDDQPPLEALAGVGGQHPHRVAVGGALRQRVGRDLLRRDVLEERQRARAGQPVDVARRGVEQPDDRVEGPVGDSAARPAARAVALQPVGQPGRLPGRPEHVLDRPRPARAALGRRPDRVQQPAQQGQRPRRTPRQPAGTPGDGLHQQHVGRRPAARGEVRLAEPAAQAPHGQGVGADQRAPEQQQDRLLVEPLGAQRGVEQVEQGPDDGLLRERHLVGRHDDRHAGRQQAAAQRRERAGGRPQEHRHVGPGDPVVQVRPAQDVGHEGGLAGRGGGEAQVHPALPRRDLGIGREVAEPRSSRPAGSRAATDRLAASSTGADRRQVRSSTCGAGSPSAVRKASGKPRMPRTSAPRNP